MKNILIPLFLLVISFCSCKQNKEPLFTETGTKEVNGTRLHYKIIGKGEPILVIHGGPGLSHDYFLPSLTSLANNHQLIFYDQRASGKSDINVASETVSLNNFIKDIEAIREAFGLEKLNIMAHSWGGIIAMKYAIQFPDRTNSLILINSIGASSEINNLSNIELANRLTQEDSLKRASIVASDGFKKRDIKTIESLMKIGFKHQFYNKAYLDSLNLSLNENFMATSQLLQNLAKDLNEYDFHSELKTIGCPTLLIYGNFDPLTQLAGAKIHESIDHSELMILDKCGHFPFIENRNEFDEVLTNFMTTK